MTIVLMHDCEYSEYCASIECAKQYCEGTAMPVTIIIGDIIVNEISCEWDDDDRSWSVLQKEYDTPLSKIFPEIPNYSWVEDTKANTMAKIVELEAQRDAIKPIVSRNSIHALVSDDFDNDCQEFLEASWELRDINDELDKLYYELEILDK